MHNNKHPRSSSPADDLRAAILEQDAALICAVLSRDPAAFKSELAVDIDDAGGDQHTLHPFHLAAWLGLTESMAALAPFCDPEDWHESELLGGATPLMALISTGSTESIERLLPMLIPISDCDKIDFEGCTALHLAVSTHQSMGAIALLARATDLSIENYDGITAMEIARENFEEEVQAVLRAEDERRNILSSCAQPSSDRARAPRL